MSPLAGVYKMCYCDPENGVIPGDCAGVVGGAHC